MMCPLILSACGGPCSYTVSEESFHSDGKQIFAELYRPSVSRKVPLVIFSHGFGATYQSGKAYAEALAPLGYAVCCFDFCGGSPMSRSEGSTTQMSLFSEARDLKAVMDQLREKDFIDPGRIILMGESQGGMVSAMVAAERKESIERLILIYPAFCIKDDWVTKYPTLEDMPEEVDLWGMKLSRAYLKGLYELSVSGIMRQYEGPVAIFHGDQDQVVALSYSEEALKAYKNASLTVLPGEGHGFSPAGAAQTIEAIKELLR